MNKCQNLTYKLIKTRNYMGTGSRRRALVKKFQAIKEEQDTKIDNKNPKLKNNGKWLKGH